MISLTIRTIFVLTMISFCGLSGAIVKFPEELKMVSGGYKLVGTEDFKIKLEDMLTKLTVSLKDRVQKNRRSQLSGNMLDTVTTTTAGGMR